MMLQLLVALAGGLGAVARFLVEAELVRRVPKPGFPISTALINLSGSLLLGVLSGWFAVHGAGEEAVKQLLGTGFLGGYTTFSTASVEAARLVGNRRGTVALLHAAGMAAGCILLAACGVWLGRIS